MGAACCAPAAKQVEHDAENVCVKCCKMTFCNATAKCTKENVDFLVDVGTWKQAFGTPTCKCLGPYGLLAIRSVLLLFWLSIVIWRGAAGMLQRIVTARGGRCYTVVTIDTEQLR